MTDRNATARGAVGQCMPDTTSTRVAESMSDEELGRWRSVRGTDADPTRNLGDMLDSDPTTVDQLLAWSGWHWMPGMRDSVHDRGIDVDDGGFLFWVDVDRRGRISRIDLDDVHDARPDMDHLGTLGLIAGLLREAWGPDAIIEVRSWGDGTDTIHVIVANDVVHSGWRRPRGDALVAACLAAPSPLPEQVRTRPNRSES